MMGFLAALKSPQAIGMIVGGLALIALLWSWHSRGQQIDILQARLDTCASQRAEIASTNGQLAADIESLNAAVRAREADARRLEGQIATMAQDAREAKRQRDAALSERLSTIDRTAIPESTQERLDQCEQARSYLVR